MKRIFKIFTYSLFALSFVLASCSAEDGQDGITGKDGIDGVDGTSGTNGIPGQDGVNGAIDLGWGVIELPERTEEQESITLQISIDGSLTAEQIETLGIFTYVRSTTEPDPKFALPTNLIFGDEMNPVPYNISFFGIDQTSFLYLIEREDGAPIPVDAVIPDLEIKIILVPSSPAGKYAIAKTKILD